MALFLREENYDKKSVKNIRTEQSKLQKKIDDIDIKIKNYTTRKKEYEKLEKKCIDCTHPKEEKNNE